MIGVLAIQGGFVEHEKVLNRLNLVHKRVKALEDLDGLTGLILPGGESTVMARFLDRYKMRGKIIALATNPDFKIYGTCAGLILLASKVDNLKQMPLCLLDISVERNAYGRQVSSFIAELVIHGEKLPVGYFIRAPKIIEIGKDVEIVAKYNDDPVLVRKANIWASSFHPELAGSTAIHELIFS